MTSYRVKMTLQIEVESDVIDDGNGEPELADAVSDVRSHLQWLSMTTTGRAELNDIIREALADADIEVIEADDDDRYDYPHGDGSD